MKASQKTANLQMTPAGSKPKLMRQYNMGMVSLLMEDGRGLTVWLNIFRSLAGIGLMQSLLRQKLQILGRRRLILQWN